MEHRKYYIRVIQSNCAAFEAYLEEQKIFFTHLSNDFGPKGSSSLYAVVMDSESALTLNLKFPVLGCLNFKRTLDNLNNIVHRCDDGPTVLK
jgi:hypothetical protein